MLSDAFKSKWAYEFGLVYSVTLGTDRLETTLQVRNTGETAFEFQTLLHTYFRVPVGDTLSIKGVIIVHD
jgi:glucose-6-phosphate 1-epimerase